jgi:hypothetical protein
VDDISMESSNGGTSNRCPAHLLANLARQRGSRANYFASARKTAPHVVRSPAFTVT